MNRKNITVIFVFLLFLSVYLVCTNYVQRQINRIKVEEKLTDADPLENAPPIVAFTTIALGSFRGLVADILWLRTVSLQDKGQYFEMVQLASWITKLQPRFTGATAYLAWNMAYNISVTFSAPEDRWRWISRGIELIRDEALAYNPADPVLYKELGWIYQHKLGNVMDDANIYYKNQMALDLMKVFGGIEPDWGMLAAAPEDEAQFKKRFPATDPFWKALKDSSYDSIAALDKDFRNEGKFPKKFTDSLGDNYEVKALDSYFRKKWLKEKYKIYPDKIIEIDNRYGKFDWRLPESHAIYWATLGLEHDKGSTPDINCERMITQSLAEAFKGGRLLMVDRDNFRSFMSVPNLELADAVKKTFEDVYERQKSNSFKGALENFIKDAIVLLYNFGRYSKAQKYLEDLRKLYPGNAAYKKDIDSFVLKEWTEDVKDATVKQAMDIISGLIYRSMYFLAYGDPDAAASHEKLAIFVYNYYKESQSASWNRVGLPPFTEVREKVVKSCLANFPKPLADSLRIALEHQGELQKQ